MTNLEVASIIRDLLRIAGVAMPPNLFEQDIRVRLALDLLATLDSGVSIRVPDYPAKSHAQRLAQLRPVEQSRHGLSFITDLPWDLVEALAKAQESMLPTDPSAAVNVIVRDWCESAGFLPPPDDAAV